MGIGTFNDGLAKTPPMGWNSWNHFGPRINEEVIRETAQAIVDQGLAAAGYKYVVIDDRWQAPERDSSGNLRPNPNTFPSGIGALADFVHSLGLKFGIYTDAGTKTCEGLPGSLGYELRDAKQFAKWGADYVKVDWCHTTGLPPRATYQKWAIAFRSLSRPMIFSICEWGRANPWEWAGTVGHLWRTTEDIQDSWTSLMGILDANAELYPYAGSSHWNDPDMLEVGNGQMTQEEYRTHFSLWALMAAPLMAGNDVRGMQESTRKILTACEIIAVNQDPAGIQGRRIRKTEDQEVWVKPLAGGKELALALFNRSGVPQDLEVSWEEMGLERNVLVRDLWARADLGQFTDGYQASNVPPHQTVVLKAKGHLFFLPTPLYMVN